MRNIWTVIRFSGRPWHEAKWQSARDVLEAVKEENSHGGSTHDSARMLLHNGKTVVPDELSTLAWRLGEFSWDLRKEHSVKVNNKVEEMIPYEKERKQNDGN